ncbi:MAG: phytanoyl-CoA dioxygenase family protein [Planctomycetota bacterium]
MADVTQGYEDSTYLLGDAGALRARGEADGYLFFAGRIPTEPLVELRRQIISIIDKHGLLHADSTDDEPRADAEKVSAEPFFAGCTEPIYTDVQRLELFHRIAHHPTILDVFETLFAGPVLPHPRNIARVLLPGKNARPTPPHQDYIHIQGAVQTWTAWFPLTDVPRELGGLSVMPASHRKGIIAVGGAEGAGGLETQLCPGENTWIEHDFKLGDVLIFPSTTVHKGLPNQLGDRIRLSCDFRYQDAADDIEQQSLDPHRQVLTWDEIYAGWERDDLKYYWQKHDLHMSLWDESIRWQKERICN